MLINVGFYIFEKQQIRMAHQNLMTFMIHVSLNSSFLLMKWKTFNIDDTTENSVDQMSLFRQEDFGIVPVFKVWSPNAVITWQYHCSVVVLWGF